MLRPYGNIKEAIVAIEDIVPSAVVCNAFVENSWLCLVISNGLIFKIRLP